MNNLLSNALKFTGEGGKVSIDVGLTTVDTTPSMKISIADNGVGIPAGELPMLFDYFRQVSSAKQTTEKGTGLGLAICKQIVQAHNGIIGAESELNKGTTIYFTIPL